MQIIYKQVWKITPSTKGIVVGRKHVIVYCIQKQYTYRSTDFDTIFIFFPCPRG